MTYLYAILPVIAWIMAGCLKFIINYLRYKENAFERIGNGGFPSTHTTVVGSAVMLVGLKMGFNSPMFSLGMAFLIVTMIDALGIRRALGKHAHILNNLLNTKEKLRESQGHNLVEVIGGLIFGSIIGYLGYLLT